MVFSGVDEAGRDNGHGGDITGGNLSVIGTSTDVDDVSGNTGATLGETETGTREETEMRPCKDLMEC